MQSACSPTLPERGPDRLIGVLVGRLADHRGRTLEAGEGLGERVGPEGPLAIAKVRLLVAVRVADVGEVDVEGRSRLDRRIGPGEGLRERLDAGEAAVGD